MRADVNVSDACMTAGSAVATCTTAACFVQDLDCSTGARGTQPKLLDIERPDLSPIVTYPTALPSIRGHAFMDGMSQA